MSCHGKGQTDIHPAGIALDGSVDKFLDFREGDDLVELVVDLRLPHAQYCSVQVKVFATGELRVEACAHLQQRSYAPVDLRPTARGLGDPRQDLQECTLPRAVSSDKTDNFALFDLERKVLEGPDSIRPTVDRRRS